MKKVLEIPACKVFPVAAAANATRFDWQDLRSSLERKLFWFYIPPPRRTDAAASTNQNI